MLEAKILLAPLYEGPSSFRMPNETMQQALDMQIERSFATTYLHIKCS